MCSFLQEMPDLSAFGGVRHRQSHKNPRLVYNQCEGSGGAGIVDAAQTHLLGRHVYKWPHDNLGDDLEEEAKNLDTFKHPFVVSFYGRCVDTLGTVEDSQGKRGLVLERMDTSADKLLQDKRLRKER